MPNRLRLVKDDEETRSVSKSIFELKYKRVIEEYLYKRENCGFAKGIGLQGSVLELQMCHVVETLPWRNFRSIEYKGV